MFSLNVRHVSVVVVWSLWGDCESALTGNEIVFDLYTTILSSLNLAKYFLRSRVVKTTKIATHDGLT